ncbi:MULTISPECIES: type II toxin-antitoxin system VapC family toxin [Fischerella]|uniref:PIN domain-containing protein n=1 Tax=Fischerella muscicola CCMEE 5323 TaxID=2019572 RepID=A0A2N6K220_FISMU|nr:MULTISPECIES: PIN domain-containing protein [Fischerella]MBD2433161.1 PIN domain-containing protein [Fischerella sp. FACHB-380]PLZ88974.1 PIN domain-containing protein [Fischerella muscicola CCMEE 5323]
MTSYLLDTNIILRFTETHSSEYEIINNAIFQILLQGGQCFITPQVLIEFWVVATRPVTVNGLGWTPEETERAVQMLINQFEWLEETPDIFRIWLSLATTHKISGKRIHDLRIQAIVLAHNIGHILTLNPKDFIEVEGITIVHPNSINS